MIARHDKEIVRRLASESAEIAALPVQEKKRAFWRRLNARKPVRPMVMIDQVCWNEMSVGDELTLQCEDRECRAYEERLRRMLYQWKHFPVDMVVEPSIKIPKAINNSYFGVQKKQKILVTDPTSDVCSHAFENQFTKDEDLEKVKMPVVSHNTAETARRMDVARNLFSGTLEPVEQGYEPYVSIWDQVSQWMSVEGALYALADRPEFMYELGRRIAKAHAIMLDQMEEQGLLCGPQPTIHCTGAYSDDLPAPGFDPKRPRTKDIWVAGLAQMFVTVSPATFQKYEIDLCKPVLERFGLVYYGCCEPLDRKMKEVRQIPNIRKVSMSPWVNEELGASEIRGDYVYSRKPSPAILATFQFNEQAVRDNLQTTVDVCQRHGCPLELILKDISTVCYEPRRLWRWADIAMEVVGAIPQAER